MENNLAEGFRTALLADISAAEVASPFREAAQTGDLATWTRLLTSSTIRSCTSMGWRASGKQHRLDLLPVPRCEYLALDVMAFAKNENRWVFPAGAFELENSVRTDKIEYSLWKVLCVRAAMRSVFCYRKKPEEAAGLVRHLRDQVIAAMEIGGRVALEGQTMVVVGSRNDSSTFPYGFFSWWELNRNTGAFERI